MIGRDMLIHKRIYPNRLTATIKQLCSQYKVEGLNKYKAWNQFVVDRANKPEVNKIEFWSIFANTQPIELVELELVPFKPTHYDSLRKKYVQIIMTDNWEMLWEDGETDSILLDKDRFLSIEY